MLSELYVHISSMYHSLSQSAHLCRLVPRNINVTFVKHGCSWHNYSMSDVNCSWYNCSNYSMSDVNSSRERERERNACQVMDDSMMSNPRRLLWHVQCLFSYFLIYLAMWLKQIFKWKGENLTNLHMLWQFCFCYIVLAWYGLQKWQKRLRFGVEYFAKQLWYTKVSKI